MLGAGEARGGVDPVLVGVGTGSLCGERTKWSLRAGRVGQGRVGWGRTGFLFFSPCGVGGGSACGCAAGAFFSPCDADEGLGVRTCCWH